MSHSFYIGVDGGATKCIVSIEDETGRLLGRETSGPANIRISVEQAWESIFSAIEKIITPHSIQLGDKNYHWHVGMGLAGCEIVGAYESFLEQSHPFETLLISSDAHTACLGAHGGKDGAIIIIGTGVVGFQVESNQTTKVGGWGFPHDDLGGGAWLGLEAAKTTLQALDGRIPVTNLTKTVFEHFNEDLNHLVTWANQANSTAFAELAPLVIKEYLSGDTSAKQIMEKAADLINRLSYALETAQTQTAFLSCSLIGGVAPFIEPLLSQKLRARLAPCQLTPDAGAILMVRDYLTNNPIERE